MPGDKIKYFWLPRIALKLFMGIMVVGIVIIAPYDYSVLYYNWAMIQVSKNLLRHADYSTAIAILQVYRHNAQSFDQNSLLNLGHLHLRIGNYEQAYELLCDHVSRRPDDRLAHFFLGETLARQNRQEEAVSHWRIAGAEPYFVRIAWELLENRPDDAEAALQIALAIKPTDPKAHQAYGFLLDRSQQYTRAMAHYLTAYENSKDPEFLVSIGVDFLRQGDAHSALEVFKQAYELKPADGIYAVHVGDAYRAAGEMQDALLWYSKGARLVPDWEPLPLRYIGEVLMEQGHVDEAIHHFDLALQRSPDSSPNTPILYFRLAQVRESLSDYEGAAKALENAIHFDPHNALYHLVLGKLLLHQGAIARAVSELEMAKQLSVPGTEIFDDAQQLLDKAYASQ